MTISVEATIINMTVVPKRLIEEDSVVEYVCQTGYAYPDAPVVEWFMDYNLLADNVHTERNNTSPGNELLMTKSTLILTTKRTMNNRTVKCALKNDDTKFNEHNLNVICKYSLVFVS